MPFMNNMNPINNQNPHFSSFNNMNMPAVNQGIGVGNRNEHVKHHYQKPFVPHGMFTFFKYHF
jgi:hypothetical protein